MNLKTRIIINGSITSILGAVCLCLGIIKDIEQLIYMGTAMVLYVVVRTLKQRKILTDKEKLQDLENAYNDERTVFIARKSYSFAFWISVYAEFIGVLVAAYLKAEDISTLLAMIVCLQAIVYAFAYIFYNRKY